MGVILWAIQNYLNSPKLIYDKKTSSSSNKSVTNCLKSFFKVWGKPDTENWKFQDIDDTANDADINLSCEVNIIANANDINAQTTTIEESSNSQAAVESTFLLSYYPMFVPKLINGAYWYFTPDTRFGFSPSFTY